jgi:hypothetical protein
MAGSWGISSRYLSRRGFAVWNVTILKGRMTSLDFSSAFARYTAIIYVYVRRMDLAPGIKEWMDE